MRGTKPNNLTTRYEQEKPVPVIQHRKRTEAEMRKALAIIESKKECLRINPDDDHDVVLSDAVTELLAMRDIMIVLMQRLDSAHQEAESSIKNMSIT